MERKPLSVCISLLLLSGCVCWGCSRRARPGTRQSEYEPRSVSAVSSSELSATTIVPTLDTPLGESGNAVWCATFQAAWNRVRDDVTHDALQISDAEAVVDRLNSSPVTETVLPSDSHYAAAGRTRDGIAEEIQREMAQRFPSVQAPTFPKVSGPSTLTLPWTI